MGIKYGRGWGGARISLSRGSVLSREYFPLVYHASSDLFVCLHWKNPRFTAFLDSNLHTRLAIVTANELGLAFPPRNLPKKFRQDPSAFYLVIVVTDKQTDRQTYAGNSIIPRESFRGDNEDSVDSVRDNYGCVRTTSCERAPAGDCSNEAVRRRRCDWFIARPRKASYQRATDELVDNGNHTLKTEDVPLFLYSLVL